MDELTDAHYELNSQLKIVPEINDEKLEDVKVKLVHFVLFNSAEYAV